MSENSEHVIARLSNKIKELIQTHNSTNDAHNVLFNTKADTYHTHGPINNDGTINSDTTSINKVVVTDSNNRVKTISNLPIEEFIEVINSKDYLDDGVFLYGSNDEYFFATVSATKDEVNVDEDTQISVVLKRGSNPLSNEIIKFNDGIDTFFIETDDNGVASHTYTGSGRGLVVFTISYNTLLEEIYEIKDGI